MINITPELAEICGIHAGDGYLRGKDHRKELDISGNIEEKDYYNKHVKELFKRVFGIEVDCRFFKHRNTYGFVIRDKKIIEMMHQLGFPYGVKSTILKVPEKILGSKNEEISTSFLRGLFDTDGCLHFWKRNKGKYSEFKKTHHYYPIIKLSTISPSLHKEVRAMFKKLKFGKLGNYIYNPKKETEKIKYTTTLYGKSKINLFFKKIGSKNPVKLSRFLVWKRLGYCPANTTLKRRLELLNLKTPITYDY